MNRITSRRPSPALAISILALFVSLGGVGYAAATIGSGDIKNNSIRGKDIRNKTITGKDVKNRSLVGKKIKANNVGGNAVKESSLGKVPSAASADNAGTVGGRSAASLDDPAAFAYVNADGTVNEALSKGVRDANVVKDPGSGVYGFRNLGFQPRSVTGNPAMPGAGVTGSNPATFKGFVGNCTFVDGVDQACVAMNEDTDITTEAEEFFVVFH